jgi:hypothetical protein
VLAIHRAALLLERVLQDKETVEALLLLTTVEQVAEAVLEQ